MGGTQYFAHGPSRPSGWGWGRGRCITQPPLPIIIGLPEPRPAPLPDPIAGTAPSSGHRCGAPPPPRRSPRHTEHFPRSQATQPEDPLSSPSEILNATGWHEPQRKVFGTGIWTLLPPHGMSCFPGRGKRRSDPFFVDQTHNSYLHKLVTLTLTLIEIKKSSIWFSTPQTVS